MRPKASPDDHASDPPDRTLPARPGDPQGVRAGARKRKESAEHKLQQEKKASPRFDGRGDGSSGQVPVSSGAVSDRPSEMKQVRTSIATNPKMSYPAAAPYMGQSGIHRAERGPEAKAGESSGHVPAQRGEPGNTGPTSFSGMRPVVRDPKPSGAREVAGSRPDPRRDERLADDGEEGVAWQLIALSIAILVLVGGFLAWKLGWLGGAAPMQSGLVLLLRLQPSCGAEARRLLRPR